MKFSGITLILWLGIGLLTLSSCNSNVIFNKSVNIDKAWNKNDSINFDFEITDTLAEYNFYINIRHSVAYAYRNIYFFVRTEFPNGNVSRDTIECLLADVRGKWYGKGLGDIKENKILIRKNLQFPVSGFYHINFVQAMREDELSGLSDVGIQISKSFSN